MSPRLAFALDAAYRAGRFTLSHFQAGVAVDLKSDNTPVTVADRGAERMIREAIAREYPSEVILGEEEGGDRSAPDRWIIDPIDGTKSFVSGVPLYSTLLSYEVDGQPIIGVCYFPALDEMLYAEVGGGSFFNGRPCHVSTRQTLRNSIITSAGHKGMSTYGRMAGIVEISQEAMATRTWCDAYGHSLVATGRADAMLDPVVTRWDISAVTLIVREAGGTCTDFGGRDALIPAHADGNHELVSSNGLIHQELLSHFAR